MYKIIILILLGLTVSICKGQTAEEIYKQAKGFLANGDNKNAVPLLKKAAEMGQAEAQYNYGLCFQRGIEVERDFSIANDWFLKSANQGLVDAQSQVAYNYAMGFDVTQDFKQAFYWSFKCAEQNDLGCMFSLVRYYQEGRGTNKNLDSMMVWAIRLGSLPDSESLPLTEQITSIRANLAIMYYDGENVTKDPIKSYMWFLIYNESKRDISIGTQKRNINIIKELEQNLKKADKRNAGKNAEKQLGRKLKNLENLYKEDVGFWQK